MKQGILKDGIENKIRTNQSTITLVYSVFNFNFIFYGINRISHGMKMLGNISKQILCKILFP